jgi:hypothetical protein
MVQLLDRNNVFLNSCGVVPDIVWHTWGSIYFATPSFVLERRVSKGERAPILGTICLHRTGD